MIKKGLLFICVLLFISCNSSVNETKHLVDVNKNGLVYIKKGADIKDLKIKTHNVQKNSHVIQNDAININEKGSIRIGN